LKARVFSSGFFGIDVQLGINMKKISGPRILVAMDFDNKTDCLALAQRLDPALCRLKVGKELFTHCGPTLVSQLQALGFEIFLDLKFHDIPNTVAKAVKAAGDLGVWMVNVHASGGARMMEAAAGALVGFRQPPLLIAVTVLTSMEAIDLVQVGIDVPAEQQVLRLARLTMASGLNGVVCSAREAMVLREQLGENVLLVTPGIRPEGSDLTDQRRVLTPVQALTAGSDYLVIGRPITGAQDPVAMCRAINESLLSLEAGSP
jgi:orotidine-5'-phosphate decarboxylase